jgi:integrase
MMAYIRAHDTTAKRKGKPVRRYEVVWREPATDANGLPNGKTRARQESYPTREAAEARRDELNAAKHTLGGTTALADAKVKAARTFADYGAEWLAAQQLKVANGRLKQGSYDSYSGYLSRYALKAFGSRAVGSITRTDMLGFLASLGDRSRATRRLAWQVLMSVLDYTAADGALAANPGRGVARNAVPATPAREHRPLTGPQVAALAQQACERSAVDELLVLFMCYTGLRKTEAQGLELRDLTLATGPKGTTGGTIRVQRTKARKGGQWVTDTPKTKRSNRTVPLPPWLAAKFVDYLANTHAAATNPNAPLWPRRVRGAYPIGPYLPDARRRPALLFDYTVPLDLDGWAKRVLRPALKDVGLGEAGVRLHDTRHTFAALQLSAGVHFMQVSRWLGHANYTLTLNTYGEWIPAEDGGVPNTLPEPKAAPAKTNVVRLRRAAQG